ncbi:pyruvate kinase [Echinicola sediminis]
MNTVKVQLIIDQVEEILKKLGKDQRKYAHVLSAIHPYHLKSATNLINYHSLRSFDLRDLQRKLGYLGMSRLARAEAHIEASLKTTRFYLYQLIGKKRAWPSSQTISIKKSEKQLLKNSNRLFGDPPANRRQRIMVTMPASSADDYELVEQMIQTGMKIARINCAHETKEDWRNIILHIRAADQKLGKKTVVAMDIGGPKIRTGEMEKSVVLHEGDVIHLSKTPVIGKAPEYTKEGRLLGPMVISCTLPEVFDYIEAGDPVFFDDGVIKGRIVSVQETFAEVKILWTGQGSAKLKADKGINFPESNLSIRGLTKTDRDNLPFIAEYADIVNFSFVNTAEDVREMHQALSDLGVLDKMGIIYKIETQAAYNNLIQILLEAMKAPKVGVMIARGDLAIEAGWEQMGNIQKEMLAICNACHVPIVWATQVLEKLAKKGLPSRSEITDAVNATKAECIMLNKGPHIVKAIELLDQIIVDAEQYQHKNAPVLSPLKKLKRNMR